MLIDQDSSEANQGTLAILSGSKVLVWDLSSSSPNGDEQQQQPQPNVRAFDPYPHYEESVPISSLAWNHNQMVIATSSGISTDDFAHDNIILLSSQGGQTLDSFQHDSQWKQKAQQQQRENNSNNNEPHRPGSAVRSVSFGGKSRYLCIGDESGAVRLWDLKKKIRVRQFFHASTGVGGGVYPHPSHQVSLDPTDTYVLSLSPSSLYQYNLRDGQLVATLPVPKHMGGDNVVDIDVARFTVFAISDLKPNLCAIGTDDGRIYIHDIANPSNQPPLMAQRHGGAVTGLAYSSVHPNVLFSCGRDGVILVHHTSEGTSQTLVGAGAEASILSMSLHANGTTCAVGCDSGDVLVYDFRIHNEAAELSASLLASFRSNEPIHSLFFAPPPRSKDKLRQSSSSSSTKVSNKENSGARPPPSSTTTAAAPKTPVSPTRRSLATKLAALRSSASPKRTRGGSPPKAPSPSSPLHNYNRIRPRSPALASENTNAEQIREVVREEVENLQDEMEDQLRNLHIDMINQFHQQSREIEAILSKHFTAMEGLVAENQQLREENERLCRMGHSG